MKERCEASGFPVPKITWLQNGKQMPLCVNDGSNRCTGQNYQVIESSSDEHAFSQSALSIEPTMYPRDQGNYTCLASSSEGSVNMTMDVFVHSKYNARLLILCGMVHLQCNTHYLYMYACYLRVPTLTSYNREEYHTCTCALNLQVKNFDHMEAHTSAKYQFLIHESVSKTLDKLVVLLHCLTGQQTNRT